MNDRQTTISELKRVMDDFVRSRQWQKYHRPKNLAMSIAIEAGELMEQFQWLDHEETDTFLTNDRSKEKVAHEMADLLAFLLALSNSTGIDLASSFEAKMQQNEKKYPIEKVRGHYQRPD